MPLDDPTPLSAQPLDDSPLPALSEVEGLGAYSRAVISIVDRVGPAVGRIERG